MGEEDDSVGDTVEDVDTRGSLLSGTGDTIFMKILLPTAENFIHNHYRGNNGPASTFLSIDGYWVIRQS